MMGLSGKKIHNFVEMIAKQQLTINDESVAAYL